MRVMRLVRMCDTDVTNLFPAAAPYSPGSRYETAPGYVLAELVHEVDGTDQQQISVVY